MAEGALSNGPVSQLGTASSAIPQVAVPTMAAPGKTGPKGLNPRQVGSQVNVGSPPSPDAGAAEQKTAPPILMGTKTAERKEGHMLTIAGRVPVQDMVKAAMSASMEKLQANRAAVMPEGQAKTASAEDDAHPSTEKLATLAQALEYVAGQLKSASIHISAGSDGTPAPGQGPNHLPVSKSEPEKTLTVPPGKAKTVSGEMMHNATAKDPAHIGGSHTAVPNDLHKTPGGTGEQTTALTGTKKHAFYSTAAGAAYGHYNPDEQGNSQAGRGALGGFFGGSLGGVAGGALGQLVGHPGAGYALGDVAGTIGGIHLATRPQGKEKEEAKHASAPIALIRKLAADQNNPAQISAGAAVPPETRASGESGGTPPAGASMVASTEAAINYTKGQAKAEPKRDLGAYVSEPAQSSSTDPILGQVFESTPKAGVKIASLIRQAAAAQKG